MQCKLFKYSKIVWIFGIWPMDVHFCQTYIVFASWIDFYINFHHFLLFTELDNAELYVPVDPNKIPKFLSKPSTYQVVTKDTIVLPCEVYNPGKLKYLFRLKYLNACFSTMLFYTTYLQHGHTQGKKYSKQLFV